jgi:hypothetical protein
MKKIILIILLFITFSTYSQIDYNIYIGRSKKEISQLLKEDEFKPSFQDKFYVDIDSTGKWFLDDNHYTYLVYYLNIRALFTFNNKTNRCVRYYLLCKNLENYWLYFDYYNQLFTRNINSENLIWIEKRHKYYVEINLKALTSKQFQIFVKTKPYKK